MESLIKRYIPEKVLEHIQSSSFKNKDHLYVICDMIYRIGIYRKSDDYTGYVDIPYQYFTDIITKKSSFKTAMSYLLDNNILLCDKIFVVGIKSFGYKFSDNYISKLTSVSIKKGSLGARIINNINSKNNLVNVKYKKYKENFFNNFKIDFKSAKTYIDQWFEEELEYLRDTNISTSYNTPYEGTFLKEFIKLNNKYNSYFISIAAINDGELFFRKNKTNGRIDTNLTSLKSELKQFIVQDLYQIDIVNSQPFFLLLDMLSNPSNTPYEGTFLKEIDKYDEWVSTGQFYENFEYQYSLQYNKSITRKEIKNMLFCIFYSKNDSYLKIKKIFASIFPNVMQYINDRKLKKHNDLAIYMQQLESDMCIETICQELDKNDILYYTIHDAWLVNKEDIERSNEIIIEYFTKIYNKHPKLKIESIKEKNKNELWKN
jgi:hypothetical protein